MEPDSKIPKSPIKRMRLFEYEEDAPNFSRDPMYIKVESILSSNPILGDLDLDVDINHELSWFSVVWTPIKLIQILSHENFSDITSTFT